MATEIQTHTHEVVDTDPRFLIDPKTKKITPGSANLTLAQHAVNSERITFYIPDKVVEGHDLTLCNDCQIHFENIDEKTGKRSFGPYKVEDLKAENEGVVLSWLIDEDATRYAGALIFSIHFACIGEDGEIVYDFPTLTCSVLTVGETVWNSQTMAEEYPDIIRDFERRISALEKGGAVTPEQIQEAVNNYLGENPVTTGKPIKDFKITEHADGSITMKNTFTDGTYETIVLAAGEKPGSVTYNGVAIPIEWVVET